MFPKRNTAEALDIFTEGQCRFFHLRNLSELIDVHAQEWKDIIYCLVVKIRKWNNQKKRQQCLRKVLRFMHQFYSTLILSLLSISTYYQHWF